MKNLKEQSQRMRKLMLLSEQVVDSETTNLQGQELNESNAFIGAAIKAKNEGKETFQHNGKTYRVTLKK